MKVKLIAATVPEHLSGAEELIEYAGRVCYRSQGSNTHEFIRKRISDGHLSITEHASVTFEISGISRACSHQLVRHRLASFSQESQRYVEPLGDDWYVMPPDIRGDPSLASVFSGFMNDAAERYRLLRKHGALKEDARFVLPNATKTRIILTMNFHSLLHLFETRISRYAQWEIREMCERMQLVLATRYPSVFGY